MSPDRAIPAGGVVRGRLTVPPSKSVSHRLFNLALLARRPLVVERPLRAEDTALFLEVLRALGFRVEERGDDVTLTPALPDPGELPASVELFCGNAGTLYRFLVASLTTVPGTWVLDGIPRLRERPVGPLVAALRQLGARIDCPREEGYAPLVIHGGSLRGGTARLDAGSSSQFLSALLMAGLAAPRPLTVEVDALVSAPYVDLTLDAIATFGGRVDVAGAATRLRYRVEPWGEPPALTRVRAEGDFSAAAYPAAAAALTGGEVELEGLRFGSRQGDRGFLEVLRRLGAEVTWDGDRLRVRGTGTLTAVDEDLGAMPDQVPTLAALAPFARGTTRIHNVAHLRIKESDRLAAMARELGKLGVPVEEQPAGLVIPGVWAETPPPAAAVTVDPWNDHRIAMSLALVGLRRPGVTVTRPQVVEKSYPGFWDDLERLLAP